MNRENSVWGRLFVGLFLVLVSIVVLLATPLFAAAMPRVETSSLTDLAVRTLPIFLSVFFFSTGMAMILYRDRREPGIVGRLARAMLAVSGMVLLISYVNVLLMILLVLAPINQGLPLLGFGLALLLVPVINPTARLYLDLYRRS